LYEELIRKYMDSEVLEEDLDPEVDEEAEEDGGYATPQPIMMNPPKRKRPRKSSATPVTIKIKRPRTSGPSTGRKRRKAIVEVCSAGFNPTT
jgi:hypothetical protein